MKIGIPLSYPKHPGNLQKYMPTCKSIHIYINAHTPACRFYFYTRLFGGLQGCYYLEGQGDLVSRLITPITHIVTTILPIINLLTKSPDPPSKLEPEKPEGDFPQTIVPLNQIDYGFGYVITRSRNTPTFYLLKGDYSPSLFFLSTYDY